eukprot:3079701-Prymnesium_polylepis.1
MCIRDRAGRAEALKRARLGPSGPQAASSRIVWRKERAVVRWLGAERAYTIESASERRCASSTL